MRSLGASVGRIPAEHMSEGWLATSGGHLGTLACTSRLYFEEGLSFCRQCSLLCPRLLRAARDRPYRWVLGSQLPVPLGVALILRMSSTSHGPSVHLILP